MCTILSGAFGVQKNFSRPIPTDLLRYKIQKNQVMGQPCGMLHMCTVQLLKPKTAGDGHFAILVGFVPSLLERDITIVPLPSYFPPGTK